MTFANGPLVCPYCANDGQEKGEWKRNSNTPFKLIESVIRMWRFEVQQVDGATFAEQRKEGRMHPREKAHQGLSFLKEAVLDVVAQHPDGIGQGGARCGHCDAVPSPRRGEGKISAALSTSCRTSRLLRHSEGASGWRSRKWESSPEENELKP